MHKPLGVIKMDKKWDLPLSFAIGQWIGCFLTRGLIWNEWAAGFFAGGISAVLFLLIWAIIPNRWFKW